MKNQALFSLKDKNKKLKCCLLQFLFGALRVNQSLTVLFRHGQKQKYNQRKHGWMQRGCGLSTREDLLQPVS